MLMTFLTVAACIITPVIPQLIALWVFKDLDQEEPFEYDYR